MIRGIFFLLLVLNASQLFATPLGEELLAPAAPRPAPRARPEIEPQPAIFSARSILYATRSADGRVIVTVEKGDEGDELWLYRPGDSTDLPRRLWQSPVRLAAPALNNNGTLLAFVDSRDDVKGDIWLLDLSRTENEPRRLTGKESTDDAPVFVPDGTALVYQRQLPGATVREQVRLELSTGRVETLPIGIDAVFAAPAPDGKRWLFVSRKADPGGDLWLWDAASNTLRQLTSGPERDLYPAWEGTGTILFTRFAPPSGSLATDSSPGQIFRLQLERSDAGGLPAAFPLTAGTFPAVAPLPAGEHFYFIAGQGAGGQLLSLPAAGEIPDRADVPSQWELAQLIMDRQPPDPTHARLAAYRVLARETAPTREGALAGIALAGLMERGGELYPAAELYASVARRYAGFPAEAAVAQIARLRVEAWISCGDKVASQRQSIIGETREAMDQAAQGKGSDAMARALIDGARLQAEFGDGAQAQLAAVGLYEKVPLLPQVARPLLAEAAMRRGRLLTRLERGEGALGALVEVAKNFSDQEEWAEAAIVEILDQVAPRSGDDRSALAALAERYRETLPRLAMGAWNRIGDLAYRANEWAKAKDAYRTVLEQFPPLPTPTASARFALAEVLYREERYSEATALYEKQMTVQPEDAPLYQLARAAYIRKSLAAGENLYRGGELAAARAVFLDLIRYEGRSLEAHRGYIKSVAAQGQAAELLALYRKMLAQYPEDPVLLYATGLCDTYLPGRAALAEADRLIAEAARRLPQSEYPPQTRGYIAEVTETVHGEYGGLERALTLYRRAWLLNRPAEHPENRANLDLNIGNMAFLLGRNATAWQHYSRRLAATVPFDNQETELLFLQRYAAVSFQMREKEAPITGYTRALQLAEARLEPAKPLELFGRLTRRTVERLFGGRIQGGAEKALAQQQAITADLERLGISPPEAPPAASWDRFDKELRKLLGEEKDLLSGAAAWNQEGVRKHGVELQGMLTAVEKSLEAVPRLVETTAEIHDRLALALLEADRFGPAREHFAAAFRLNKGLGHTGNLVANRRSASIAAYREAQTASGEERLQLLRQGRDGFREVLSLLEKYPPTPKKSPQRGGGLLNITKDLALDKGGATEAAYGFSAVQEERLAETYLARIAAELGDPATAATLLHGQLGRYPTEIGKLAIGDLFGVGLLAHRAAQVDHALGDEHQAAKGFRRATLAALQAGNPISSMINLVNWGELLPEGAEAQEFLEAAAKTVSLAAGYRDSLPVPALGRFHNDLGVILYRLATASADPVTRQARLFAVLEHFDRALAALPVAGGQDGLRQRLGIRAAVQLNRGAVLTALGLDEGAHSARTAALDEARKGEHPSREWRALAALGRYDEALAALERLPLTDFDLLQGELMERFAPQLAQLAARDGEGAFALLERLSEMERVQILGRGLLGLSDPAVNGRLRDAAAHLAEMDRLRETLAKAKPEEKEYLQLRLQQEQTLLEPLLGKQLEQLPSFYRLAGEGTVKLAAASAAVADAATIKVEQPEKGGEPLAVAQKRFSELLSAHLKACSAAKGGRFCSVLAPQPVEAVDIFERLPARTLLRFVPLASDSWLLFTLSGKGKITAETMATAQLAARLTATDRPLAASEEPWRFPTARVATWGLSATHLLRSLDQRKPFRRQVLDPAGWWPEEAHFDRLKGDNWLARLADAHTLVLPGQAGLLAQVPSGEGRGGSLLPLWEKETGERQSMAQLAAGESLTLVVAPRAGVKQAYGLGHLLALLQVPTLLLGDGKAVDTKPFVAAYAGQSVSAAREQLPAGWLLLGDWGPDGVEAAKLGKKQFAEYGKAGVKAHNEQRYPQALSFFENALAIARENQELTKQLSTLHLYARESAFAAGFIGRAILHAEALVKGLAKEKPYSADHADALLRLGLLQGRAEQFAAAAVSLKEGVAIFSDLGLGKEQAAALADFGVVMENSVDYQAARNLFEEAAGLRRTLKDEISLAEQYRNLGRIFDLRLNQYALAEQYYKQAQEIYAKAGNAPLEAEAMLERGRCQRLLGSFTAADALYREALARAGDKELRTRMRIVLEQANNAWFQGRYQEAFDLRELVEKSAKKYEWPLELVMAKNTGGLIWWTLGDHKRSLLELRGALERAQTLEVRKDEVATTLNNIGLVQRESGAYLQALETLDKALAIDRKLGSRWAIAYDLRNLGQTRLKMGNATEALPLLAEAATLAGEIGDRVNQTKIYLAQGDAQAQLQRGAAAEASYKKALAAADAMLLREVRWRALFGLARLQQQAGQALAALESYRQALDTVEGLRAEIRLDQLKDGFLADKMDVYAGMVGLLVDLQRHDEAFSVAERSRARNLIDILGRQRLSLSGAVDQELYDRQTRLKEQMLEQETLAAQAAKPQERAMYGQALEKLQAQYQDLLLEIERKKPELLALVKVNPQTLPEVQNLLEPGVVLLSYYQLPDRLLCWRISRDRATLLTLKVSATELAAKIASYRRMLQNLEPLEKNSRELFDLLLAQPLAGAGEIRALGIVPHGSLHYLSFATLSDGRDYLADRQQLFYLPAVSVLKYTLSRRQQEKNMAVLAVGNPDLANPALDLPFAEREAGTLRWNYANVTTLTRERATESWVREHIGQFGIIHLASHGEFDPANPLFSAVRLARDAKADGRLEAEEIFGLDIKADLVVLSACQTGLGDVRSGDDVVGMNRAFLFAGTHSLMSSLWRVSDVSTAILMKQFYRNYTKGNKAESLAQAMRHVKNRYPHPGYWGAFVLIGDYQ